MGTANMCLSSASIPLRRMWILTARGEIEITPGTVEGRDAQIAELGGGPAGWEGTARDREAHAHRVAACLIERFAGVEVSVVDRYVIAFTDRGIDAEDTRMHMLNAIQAAETRTP